MTQEETKKYNYRCSNYLGGSILEDNNNWIVRNWNQSHYPNQIIEIVPFTFHGTKNETFQYVLNNLLKENSGRWGKFHSDWNLIMIVCEYIKRSGHRKYLYSHEEHSRCVFTDMAIINQSHNFGGGNIVSDSGNCIDEKESVVEAINKFLIWNENL